MAQARLMAKMLRDPTALGGLWSGPGIPAGDGKGKRMGGNGAMTTRSGTAMLVKKRAWTGPEDAEKPPGEIPRAAVHRHSLARLNTINDSLKKNW